MTTREREIEDCGDVGVFWYRRPSGHTKTGARHRLQTPMVIEWAYVPRDGDVWSIGNAVPGFATRGRRLDCGTGGLLRCFA